MLNTVDNNKYNMNQDLFHFVSRFLALKWALEQMMPPTPTEIGNRHIRIARAYTFCMPIIKKPLELG